MDAERIIEYVDEVKPNAFSNEVKMRWLEELADTVRRDCPGPVVPEIWDKVCYSFLMARIDEANREWTDYANSLQVFNDYYDEFKAWWCREYVDKRRRQLWPD